MPYIKKERRAALDPIIDGLINRLKEIGACKGDVNYVVTRVALAALVPQVSYSNLSDAVASLRDAADEIVGRLLSPYEMDAQRLNGDLPEYNTLENDIYDKYDAPEMAASLYKDLQDEIKETLERR